jgi:effector-binding domain-containing protein
MSLTFSLIERDDQPVLSVQTRTRMNDLPETILQALRKVGQHLESLGVQPAGPAFVAYYNLDMMDSKVEIGFPISRPLPGACDVVSRILPGGPAGLCDYVGPYQDLALVYQQLNAYIEGQGREPNGISYEFYLNDPAVTPASELHTQVIFPFLSPQADDRERAVGNGHTHALFW